MITLLPTIEISSLDKMLFSVRDTIEPLQKGDNVLIETRDKLTLLKYERVEMGSKNPFVVRWNRHNSIECIGNLIINDENDSLTHKDPSKKVVEKARIEILGTHKIEFKLDDEFKIHLPSAERHTDLYLDIASKFKDGRIEKTFDSIIIYADDSLIIKRLQEIVRPEYFEQNITPFLEGQSTNLEMPKWDSKKTIKKRFSFLQKKSETTDTRKPNYREFNTRVGYDWLARSTIDLSHESFVYVGSKEEVYLLGIAKEEDNSLYKQGTYTTSTKPMLWFSNNYLGYMSKSDMNMPLFNGNGSCNVAEYRTSNPPEFNGKPFIFSAMGRRQDCKNSIFTGEPDIITGNIIEALEHFKTTDFREYIDIVQAYSDRIREPTPNAKPEGRYFY